MTAIRQEIYLRALYDKNQAIPKPVTNEEILLTKAIAHIRELEREVESLKDDIRRSEVEKGEKAHDLY